MSEGSKPSQLDWQHLGSRYEDAGLMLFEKRIDKLRNPRNDKVFERLILESVDVFWFCGTVCNCMKV